MVIALSSSAAPGAGLQELLDGCTRRGLAALHLVVGHAHGVAPGAGDRVHAAAALSRRAGIGIAGVEVANLTGFAANDVIEMCTALGAPLVINSMHAAELPAQWQSVLAAPGGAVVRGIEVNAARENVAVALGAAEAAARSPIRHVTLCGGGPEAAQHEGQGIGALMSQLALDGYRGVLALAPSSKAVLPVWRAWLHHGRKWGCGSKASDPALVQLAQAGYSQ